VLPVNPHDPKLSVAIEHGLMAGVVVGTAVVAIVGNSWLVSGALFEILRNPATGTSPPRSSSPLRPSRPTPRRGWMP
jgi:hypothetical protein